MTRTRLLAWALVGLDLLLWLFGIALLSLPRVQPFASEIASPFAVVTLLAFAIVGAAIVSRQPGHLVGWIFCASGVLIAIAMVTGAFYGHVLDPTAPFGILALDLNGIAFWNGHLVPMTYGLLLFPEGRLPSRRWVPLAVLIGSVLVSVSAVPVMANHGLGGGEVPELLIVAELGCVAGVAASIVVRWRRARALERAQLKWVAVTASLFLVTLIAVATIAVLDPAMLQVGGGGVAVLLFGLSVLLVPASIGVAITRYRLYDIDILINQALVYGATTAAIAIAFFLGIVVLQALLRPITAGSEVAVAASTLISVALFQPLRRRVQAIVDRRFYRSRYDATRVLDAFSARLRDEVDLDAVRVDLLDAVDRTVQPAHATVWLRTSPLTFGGRNDYRTAGG